MITAAAGGLPKKASSLLSAARCCLGGRTCVSVVESMSTAARFLERGEYGHDVRTFLTQAIATLTDPHEAVERAEHTCQAARAAETPQAEP